MASMRALVKARPEPGLWLEEAPIPEPGDNDVLIKVLKTGICGTDLYIYNWTPWAQKTVKPPIIIGHEFGGQVAAVGKNVQGIKEGEIVGGEGHITCGRCRNCLSGRRHLCPETYTLGVKRPGIFAEYVSLPAENVWQAHPSITPEMLSIFDPFGNATYTTLSFDLVGEDVLITGAGPIGVMSTAIARHAGARYIVVTNRSAYRRELAQKAGADLVINPEEESLDEAKAKLGMVGDFTVGLEMSGSPVAFNQMLDHMHSGGGIGLLGLLPEGTVIDWGKVIFKTLTIKGIFGRKIFETWFKMEAMLQSGLDVSPVITHRLPAEDFEQGFEAMNAKECGKVVLDWS